MKDERNTKTKAFLKTRMKVLSLWGEDNNSTINRKGEEARKEARLQVRKMRLLLS